MKKVKNTTKTALNKQILKPLTVKQLNSLKGGWIIEEDIIEGQ